MRAARTRNLGLASKKYASKARIDDQGSSPQHPIKKAGGPSLINCDWTKQRRSHSRQSTVFQQIEDILIVQCFQAEEASKL